MKKSKNDRILSLYTMLDSGAVINKTAAAGEFGVTERTIQRDIDDIRAFFTDNTAGVGLGTTVIFDRAKNGYRIDSASSEMLTKGEILTVCKVLLESRCLVKEEMLPIIDKLIGKCVPVNNKNIVRLLTDNEKYHYIEPRHGQKLVELVWVLGEAIMKNRIIEITYERLKDKETVRRRLKPVGVMVSEFYFYLTAFIDDRDKELRFDNPDDINPTIYRIDRIRDVNITSEKFFIPYSDKFEAGEFRKKIPFMYGGKLHKTRFQYSGLSVESVLDRLPTAKIIKEENGVYILEAETFGNGIDMWLRSQGENIKLI